VWGKQQTREINSQITSSVNAKPRKTDRNFGFNT